jgi:hypothetical protein
MNSFVVPRVGHDHAQKTVGIAAHQVTFHHFGNIPRLTLEGCQITVLLAVQCDGDEHVIWETGQGLIHQTNVTPDEAILFQTPQSSQTGTLREADPIRSCCIADPAIGLHLMQNCSICQVQND